jgi:hypothetical protein
MGMPSKSEPSASGGSDPKAIGMVRETYHGLVDIHALKGFRRRSMHERLVFLR